MQCSCTKCMIAYLELNYCITDLYWHRFEREKKKTYDENVTFEL